MKVGKNIFVLVVIAIIGCDSKQSNSQEKVEQVEQLNSTELGDLLSEDKEVVQSETAIIKLKTASLASYELTVQDCSKCDTAPLVKIKTTEIGSHTYQDMFDFFCTFDTICSDNIEYQEFSNRMLYKLLSNYPQDVIKILSEMKLDLTAIMLAVSSPLLDYNYEGIIEEINKSSGDSKIKENVIESLRKAIEG